MADGEVLHETRGPFVCMIDEDAESNVKSFCLSFRTPECFRDRDCKPLKVLVRFANTDGLFIAAMRAEAENRLVTLRLKGPLVNVEKGDFFAYLTATAPPVFSESSD